MKRYANIYIMNSFSWAKVITNPSSMKHTTSLYIDIPGHLRSALQMHCHLGLKIFEKNC